MRAKGNAADIFETFLAISQRNVRLIGLRC